MRLLSHSAFPCTITAREALSRFYRHTQLPTKKARTQAIEMRAQLKAELEDLLGENGLLLLPCYPLRHAPYNGEYAWKPNRYNWLYQGVGNVLGFPALTVPLGLTDYNEGTTIRSIQLIARPYNERLLSQLPWSWRRGLADGLRCKGSSS